MASVGLRFGPFCLDAAKRLLVRGDEVVPLTPKAFDTLLFLIERHDRVVSKEELLRGLWPDIAVEEANLSQQVFLLRRALADPHHPGAEYIATVSRRGYRFVSPVSLAKLTADSGRLGAIGRFRQVASFIPRMGRVIAIAGRSSLIIVLLSTLTFRDRDTVQIVRSDLLLPNGQRFSRLFRGGPAVSPDGSVVVYAANRQLYVRKLDESDPQIVPGTNLDVSIPFFSPDGAWIGFWSAQDSSFKKVRASGGSAITIARSFNPRGAGWFGEYVVFAEGGKGIIAVPAAGGEEASWVVPQSDEVLLTPQLLPGDEAVLFTAAKVASNRMTRSDIVVYSRTTHERKVVLPNAQAARYVPSRTIVYAAGGKLFVASFDRQRLKLDGEPKLIARDLDEQRGHFDVSPMGTLVYVPCSTFDRRPAERIVELVDAEGKASPIGLPPAAYEDVQVSSDGTRLAVTTDDDGGTIWIYDMARPSAARRITFDGSAHHPVWTADSRHIAYSGAVNGVNGIFVKASDGSGMTERLTSAEPGFDHVPGSWSPDGRRIAFVNVKAGIKDTITIFNVNSRRPEEIIAVPGSNQFDPAFSPDGRWIAYDAEDGNSAPQIYVEPFPRTGAKFPLSREGGEMPVWSRDGSRLFYRVPNSAAVMSISINFNPFPEVNERVAVWIDGLASDPNFDVSSGRGIIVVIDPQASAHRSFERIALVLNWFRRDAIGRISLDSRLK